MLKFSVRLSLFIVREIDHGFACARFMRVDAGLGDISLRCSARFAELILLLYISSFVFN